MKMKHNVSLSSTPDTVDQNLNVDQQAIRNSQIPSRNLPNFYLQELYQGVCSPYQKVRFKENVHAKKFTTPIQSTPNSSYNSVSSSMNTSSIGQLSQLQPNSQYLQGSNQSQQIQTCSNFNNSIQSPSMIKIIDLRNPQVRKLVMDSLNEIIEERRKNRVKRNQNYDNIVQSTPQTLRVQNSIDQDAVLIEKVINFNDQDAVSNFNSVLQNDAYDNQNHNVCTRPPSRIAGEGQNELNNGILRMSPRSQSKFFSSLQKIYEEQDYQRLRSEYTQEPHSPEFTIVQAIDDSCVLFAVKENQINQGQSIHSNESNSGQSSSLQFQSPNVNRNFFDTEVRSFNDPDVIKELSTRLQMLENQENVGNVRRNEIKRRQEKNQEQLIEQYSTDRQFLMIHPRNLKKLTPTLKAPQISRQPSIKNIDFFDLSVPYHAEILFQRLLDIRNLEENGSSYDDNEISQFQQQDQIQISVQDVSESDNRRDNNQENQNMQDTIPQNNEENSGQSSQTKTPLPSRGPPSRGENQQIDIDLLISKLLDLTHDEFLDGLLNLSIQEQDSQLINLQQQQQQPQAQPLNNFQQGRDSDQNSDFVSSGIQTPGSLSFSTPIQAKLFCERGHLLNGGKLNKGLDLRSPQTKFNLMRKLQEVKELNNSSDEDEHNHVVAGDQPEDHMRFNIYTNGSRQEPLRHERGVVEIRALNNYSRLFINEEDEDDSDQDCESIQDKETDSSRPISQISPQRSLNCTQNTLQLRNLNQNQPSIDLLIQKLKKLEQQRMNNNANYSMGRTQSQSQSQHSSEAQSPQKFDMYQYHSGNDIETNLIMNNMGGNNQSASNILEQVIKRLEKLKRSRDSSQ